MHNFDKKPLTTALGSFCTAFFILSVMMYAVLYYQYRDTIQLSGLVGVAMGHIVLALLLVLGAIHSFKKQINSHFVSLEGMWSNVRRIFKIFNEKETGLLRKDLHIMECVADKKSGKLYSLMVNELEASREKSKKITEELNEYKTIYSRLHLEMKSVAGKSKQLTKNSQDYYQNAYSQASELEAVSRAMDQFASQISGIADHTNKANQAALETLVVTDSGVEQMHDMISAITSISESSQKILSMIKTIDQIAAQTKLLALNATIEANRAGEHGKAFAVVAQEVRDLSVHSKEAAKETSDLVDDNMRNLTEGNEISAKTVDALNRMEEEVHKVSRIIEEIAESSALQAEGVNRFNDSLKEINQITRQQRRVAKEATSVSQELSRHVEHLTDDLDQFQAQDGRKRLQEVRPEKSRIQSKPVQRPFRFIGDQGGEPLTYEKKGEVTGIFVDIIREILEKRMGIDVIYEVLEWTLCTEKMERGEKDAFFTFPSEDRLKFCDTHINTGFTFEWVFWTYTGNPRMDEIKKIKSIDDIIKSDFVVGTYIGNDWAKMELEDKGANVEYSDYEFEKLGQKKLDLIIEDPIIGRNKIKYCRIPQDGFAKINVVLRTVSYQLLINKNSPYVHILSEFDEHLRAIKKDGTMEKILSKY